MPPRTNEWFREFFGADYLRAYGPRNRRAAAAEARGIESGLPMRPTGRYLDLCCGEGRHAVALAGCGYRVTGVDRNAVMLEAARAAASEAAAAVDWIRADARELPFTATFDGAWCWFTTFGYSGMTDDDLRMLRGVHRALRPGGVFLLEVLNFEWHRKRRREEKVLEGDGCQMVSRMEFSPAESVAVTRKEIRYPDGTARRYRLSTRIYAEEELRRLFAAARFESFDRLRQQGERSDGRPDRWRLAK